MRFFFTSPAWSLSGVNTAAANLVRELNARGHEAAVLLTAPFREDDMPMTPEPGVSLERLPVSRRDPWRRRWRIFVRHLSDRAPCVYVPGYDWDYSRACPLLPDGVVTVGVVHSDEPVHYDHARRLGRYWNRTVAVSRRIGEGTAALCPEIRDRISVIPSGVALPQGPERAPMDARPIRLVYAGRLVSYQKRVMDLAAIARGLAARGVSFHLAVAGGGPQEAELARALAAFAGDGRVRLAGTLPNAEVRKLMQAADVFLLVSGFEGQPVSLLEAMAAGAVPVVTDIKSGVPELVKDGTTGFLLPVGDVDGFCNRIETLAREPGLLAEMSRAAREALVSGGFLIDAVAERYEKLCGEAFAEVASGGWRRPRGKAAPPPFSQEGAGRLASALAGLRALLPFPRT